MVSAQDDAPDKAQISKQSIADFVQRPDEDLLIFSLNLGKVLLLDTLLVYEDLETQKYFVPLRDFVDALELPIIVQSKSASGWFLEESRTFFLNLSTGKSVVSGKEFALSPENIERHEDGIYVSLEQLQNWFPVTLEVDFSQLAIVVKSLEPLPLEERLARDEKRDSVSENSADKKEYLLDDIEAPLFSFPFVSVDTQASYENADAAQNPFAVSGTMLASGIVAGQDAVVSINEDTANSEGPDIRASIGLKDVDNNLFGIGGSEYELGDVSTSTVPFIAKGMAGAGFFFFNHAIAIC